MLLFPILCILTALLSLEKLFYIDICSLFSETLKAGTYRQLMCP